MTMFTHKTLTFVGLLLLGSFILCTPGVTFAASNSTSDTASTGTAAKTSTAGTTKSYIQSAQKYTNEASGIFGSTTQATNAVNELSKSAGTGDLLGKNANILNDTGSYLKQGQSALKTADFLSDIDYKSVANGLKDAGDVDWKSLGGKLETSASNIAKNAEKYYDKVAENAGKYWDKLKGINMDSIWGEITNFQEDMSAKVKQLVAGDLSEFDLESLSKALTSAGVPVEYVDLSPVGVATVVYEGQIPIAMDSQYAANVDYSAALGPIGNMDFRNGMCTYDGHDYTGMLKDYINGAASSNEGHYPFLYLDTNCWVTIGRGSVMFQYSSARNWAGYKKYFDAMEYLDASNNPVDQTTKDADLKKFFDMEGSCRASCGCSGSGTSTTKKTCSNALNRNGTIMCVNKGANAYKKETNGRHISDQAVGDAIFNELCNDHVRILKNYSNKVYPKLNSSLQQAILDISYQAGPGASAVKTLLNNLAANNCSGAYNQFAASNLCTSYKSRCTWRLGMIKQGCNAGAFSSN